MNQLINQPSLLEHTAAGQAPWLSSRSDKNTTLQYVKTTAIGWHSHHIGGLLYK